MSQIIIDSEKVINVVAGILAIIGIIAIILFCVNAVDNRYTASTAVVITQPAPTTTQIPVPNYPSVLTFTVLSTTTSNGHYQVTTTAGNILYFTDYMIWQSMVLRATYTGTLVGTDGSAYLIGSVVLLSYPTDGYYCDPHYSYCTGSYSNNGYSGTYPYYPTYYNYGTLYYQCDDSYCHTVAYKEVTGNKVYYSKPPHPVHY